MPAVAFLKVTGEAARYEASLVATLHRADPERVVPVRAVEPREGFLLLDGAGEVLVDDQVPPGSGPPGIDVGTWTGMLTRFAVLQRAAEALVEELIATGTPDERPERLPDVLRGLLTGCLRPDGPTPLTGPEYRALDGVAARLEQAGAALGALGIPPSVQHGDLHPGNVAVGADGAARFLDFGDASIAHPFTTLKVPLEVAAGEGASGDDLRRLRDAYLAPFTDRAPLAQLREGLELALWTAALPRATAWERALRNAPVDHGWGDPVRHHVRELLPAGGGTPRPTIGG